MLIWKATFPKFNIVSWKFQLLFLCVCSSDAFNVFPFSFFMSLFIGEHYYKSFCVLVHHIFSHVLRELLHGLSRKGAVNMPLPKNKINIEIHHDNC